MSPDRDEDIFLGPEDGDRHIRPDSVHVQRVVSDNTSRPPQLLKRLPNLFARVPLAWLRTSSRPCLFGPSQRLFLLLLIRSHWGQRGVKLTSAVAAEVGVSDRAKRKCVLRWERQGWVRVERGSSKQAPVVCPIVIAG